MSKFLIDTNIIIYLMKGEKEVINFFETILQDENNELIFSVITVTEIFSRPISEKIKAAVNEFLALGTVIDLNQELALLTGVLRAEMYQQGRKVPKLPDAVIAMTAKVTGAVLITHNVKDFNQIPDLQICDPFQAEYDEAD
ncbi:tRNA(fMet)-specific endonuclease VapC [Carboxydocella sporoproducens DSM 16521]|uniref:tRNA(fMet)-specific endonuclease VapC n=2 Tax=Carboxydocella TaxID=178898 RepID=A0A1T4NH05_9FIRM|nr:MULTISPECIES: type II toxin-antitoxin system VapC family toxin [Carboxydocella]AVX20040.1 tRNA(fMet)-specific endonuclease VapC [Carboxydocella thermautotrophica]AVX30457.1 tRNA(fMet)-specific endonuclease VapC [Carboxydocella thermautotrophica]SJZ78552.1 tRNA(fMet)-specific endonuclease VapC [Carboxydocella sporoproducens DSM 16521]